MCNQSQRKVAVARDRAIQQRVQYLGNWGELMYYGATFQIQTRLRSRRGKLHDTGRFERTAEVWQQNLGYLEKK
jgi:Mlc titration factor MtfA (ptsG expression regulator)